MIIERVERRVDLTALKPRRSNKTTTITAVGRPSAIFMAISKRQKEEKEKLKERDKIMKNALKKLTSDLPKATFDTSMRADELRMEIFEAAFFSALDQGLEILATKQGHGIFFFEGGVRFEINLLDLEKPAEKLVKWSKIEDSLKTDDGKQFTAGSLFHGLSLYSMHWHYEQNRDNSSDALLKKMVEGAMQTEFKFDNDLKREDVKKLLIDHLAKIAENLNLQFFTDAGKNLYLLCSDSKFSATLLYPENVSKYFRSMINESGVGGKFRSETDKLSIMAGFTAKMPRE